MNMNNVLLYLIYLHKWSRSPLFSMINLVVLCAQSKPDTTLGLRE